MKKTYKSALQQGYIDEETGEQFTQTLITERVEGYVDLKLPQKAKFNNGNFIVLFQKSMYEIAKNRKLFTKDELTLLIYFLGTAGMGNSIFIDYPTIMEDLKIDKGNCSRSVNSLTTKGIIIRSKAKGRSQNESQLMKVSINFDQLNYNLAYNGKIKDHTKLKLEHPDLSIFQNQITIFDDINNE